MSMELKIIFVGVGLAILSVFMRWLRPKIEGNEKYEKVYKEVLEWVDTLLSAVVLAALIMNFVVQAFKIPSGSMRPTLIEGDHLFVNKFIYGFRIPFTDTRVLPFTKVKRGQIVVFIAPAQALASWEREKGITKDFIKRCIGLPGDIIEIKNKKVFVNGKESVEPYAHYFETDVHQAPKLYSSMDEYQKAWEMGSFVQEKLFTGTVRDNFGPIKVPPSCYFVMGDNRDGSLDSRFWGPLPDKFLKGTALVLYWPLNRIKIIK